MNGQQILDKFHIYTGDQSELSSAEELDLLNNKYQDIMTDRPWEFLKKAAAGSLVFPGDGTAYITLPADFRYLVENNQYTDISRSIQNNANAKVVFIGPNYTPYQVVNFSDRRQYRTSSGYCYIDIVNNKIIFPVAPTDTTYEFDYIYRWADITLLTSPIFPSEYHSMIYQMMAIDSVIINLFDRSHSYAKENTEASMNALKKLRYYNSTLINN
jgi:hypothetical protein